MSSTAWSSELADDGFVEDVVARWRAVGRVSDDELVAEYQAAWLVASASLAEGWGMMLTEAGACSTPAVATDIPGHRDAVIDGVTGRLVAEPALLGPAIEALLHDADERNRLGSAAVARAEELSLSTVAAQHLDLLCDTIERERR